MNGKHYLASTFNFHLKLGMSMACSAPFTFLLFSEIFEYLGPTNCTSSSTASKMLSYFWAPGNRQKGRFVLLLFLYRNSFLSRRNSPKFYFLNVFVIHGPIWVSTNSRWCRIKWCLVLIGSWSQRQFVLWWQSVMTGWENIRRLFLRLMMLCSICMSANLKVCLHIKFKWLIYYLSGGMNMILKNWRHPPGKDKLSYALAGKEVCKGYPNVKEKCFEWFASLSPLSQIINDSPPSAPHGLATVPI